ncbi:MAG: hypothetical protein SNJ52_02075 [Verrucomicrobiia bacterium]
MKTYAVLTGDMVSSSKLGPEQMDAAKALLHRLAHEFGETHPDAVLGVPDVFRGDSWQICLQRPALAITAAVFVRAGFKADDLDTRIGIGWGDVARLNKDRISESNGEAFTRSGQALDGLGKARRLALAQSGNPGGASPHGLFDAGVGLLDALISRWTRREAVAVYGSLRKLSQDAIAELPQARTKEGTPPTRQAIQDALRRISWSSHIQPFLLQAEKAIAQGVES